MIGDTKIIQTETRQTAAIRLTITRPDVQSVFGSAISEFFECAEAYL
jgi:hypothetical protein